MSKTERRMNLQDGTDTTGFGIAHTWTDDRKPRHISIATFVKSDRLHGPFVAGESCNIRALLGQAIVIFPGDLGATPIRVRPVPGEEVQLEPGYEYSVVAQLLTVLVIESGRSGGVSPQSASVFIRQEDLPPADPDALGEAGAPDTDTPSGS